MDHSTLEARWRSLCTRLGVAAAVEASYWAQLDAAYGSPRRFYHTLEHIAELLRLSDACAHELEERDAVELAIWFHDIVYDARGGGGGKNEDDSAAVFRTFAAEASCLSASCVDMVSGWIVNTKHHRCSAEDGTDAQLFMDMDMAVLGLPASAFDAYALQVRAEYAHVSTPAWSEPRLLQGRRFSPPSGRVARSRVAAMAAGRRLPCGGRIHGSRPVHTSASAALHAQVLRSLALPRHCCRGTHHLPHGQIPSSRGEGARELAA